MAIVRPLLMINLLADLNFNVRIIPTNLLIKNFAKKNSRKMCYLHNNRKMDAIKEKLNTKCFGGFQKIIVHHSEITNCEMQFAIYLPPQCKYRKLPVIYFLSGLAMDHKDFIGKSGSQKIASELGIILVAPDSSPRNTNIPGENDKWYMGIKASYYIDTTQEPWSKHYQMYSYITKELPRIINENYPTLPDKQSIMGFSIGGQAAFVMMLKNPHQYKSISAMSPVCDVTLAPLSMEGLEQYLGKEDNGKWKKWSAISLAKQYTGSPFHILIDQGSEDEYLKDGHLHPEEFIEACKVSGISVTFNLREGYAHNYYFIKSFIEDHIKYHSRYLK